MKRIIVSLFSICFAAVSLFLLRPAYAVSPLEVSAGYVNDVANVLSSEVRKSLEERITAYEQETTNEIAVVTIDELPDDQSIEDFSNALFRSWGIGKEDKNNGVLFLLAIRDRQMRIEVGYGLEGDLTDIETSVIQDEFVRPYLQSGDYDSGIRVGIEEIQRAISGEVTSTEEVVSRIISDTDEIAYYDPETKKAFSTFLFLIFSIIDSVSTLLLLYKKFESRRVQAMAIGGLMVTLVNIFLYSQVIGFDWLSVPGALERTGPGFFKWTVVLVAFIVATVGFRTLMFFLGRSSSWWLGGVLGAVFGIIAIQFVPATFFGKFWPVPILVSGMLGAFFDLIASRRFIQGDTWWSFMKRGGIPGRGVFGGSSRSSSDSSRSGFGGGSSGGGGSSSSW